MRITHNYKMGATSSFNDPIQPKRRHDSGTTCRDLEKTTASHAISVGGTFLQATHTGMGINGLIR